ncbi:hypothetical protein [Sodaliphilus sp.]|uniref:hypothetical protein n=1 Tax=Sodaliphilus sp. TaxID=2815818 RepID=UPI00388FC8E4
MKRLLFLILSVVAVLQASALTVYVNYPSDVTGFYLWAWDSNGNINGNNYPGNPLTETVEMGGLTFKKFTTNSTSINVIVTDNYANKTENITGITSDCIIKITGVNGKQDGLNKWTYTRETGLVLNASNFSDANFCRALASALNVQVGDVIFPQYITSLDLSNKGLTTIPGINHFTELETLILDDNDLSHLILSSNTKLKKLSIRNNDRIIGFSQNAATANNHFINLSKSPVTPLEEFDASDSDNYGYFSAINSTYGVTTLVTLKLANCPKLAGWSGGVAKQPNLVYLDMTNNALTGGQGTGINASGAIGTLTKLETLILANNPSLTCVDVSKMPNLKYLDMSGTDLWFENREKTYLKPANNPLLETFIAENAKWATNGSIDGFQNLKTVRISGNTFTHQEISNCPALETVDVSGNAKVTYVSITNSGLTSVPTINGDNCALLKTLVLDGNQFSDVPAVSAPFTCLSLQSNNLPGVYSLSDNTLEGLDLGNNGFTSLTVENSAMSALALSGNTDLTEVHLHGNANLTKTASATGISAAQGLYIKGMSSIKVLDIENSSFEELGQSNSTDGCTGIEVLKAAHNNFKTFSNAYTTFGSSGDNGYRPATPTRSSLEKLTGLKYLDLSNNLLEDSLHLHKNTLLETLIVRNNRTITEYTDNSVVNKRFHTPGDVGEFNDTTGLRMLNLIKNTELKYLDISYTGIHHFARDGRLDKYKEDYYMANFAKRGNETAKNREPHYLLITNCNKLEEFYADYNGMKSAAFIKNYEGHYFPNLRRISMIETRGQDSYTMQGSWNPNGGDGCPNVEYINVANSDLDSIGVSKLPHLKYLNVSGNWTKNNWAHWSSNGVGHTLNLKGNSELVECVADDCPHLVIVQANDKTNLTSLSLNNNPELKQVYVPNTGLARIDSEPYGHPDANPDTRTQQAVGNLGLAGIGSATSLELLYCENNSNLGNVDLSSNTALKYLHAYNNPNMTSELNLKPNTALKSAWVSESNLTKLELNSAVLDTLKCYDNAALAALDVTESPALRYLDLARCHVADLDLSSNSALVHFDCSNDVKCSETQGNWISGLNFTSSNLKTVKASNNNLYSITLPGSLPSLTSIEFENNHINGIDLSGASQLTAAGIKDANNGRAITADNAYSERLEANVYFFQLEEDVEKGGTFLSLKTSFDELKGMNRPSLADDGFSFDKLASWEGGVSGTVAGAKKAAAAGELMPEFVLGNVAVLTPTSETSSSAEGHAEYKYNNGITQSTFYLDWTAAPNIVTAVDDIAVETQPVGTVYYNLAGQPSDTPHQGVNIVVTKNADGTTTATKVVK